MLCDRIPCRWAAGAKMLLVLMVAAALPAWTFGRDKPETKPNPNPPGKVLELGELKGLLGGLEIQIVPPGRDPKIATDIDTKIAELTKQLEALKAIKAAADKIDKAQAPNPKPDAKGRIIITVGPDGKVIEAKDADPKTERRIEIYRLGPDGKKIEPNAVDPKAAPKFEWKVLPRQQAPAQLAPLKFEIRQVDGKPQVIVIGADGKEIKNPPPIANPKPVVPPAQPAKPLLDEARKQLEKQLEALRGQQQRMTLVRPAVGGAVKIINLTRATYALPKEKADVLAAFLKANAKASVLEIVVDAEGLTVTTTPDVQTTIGGIVNLMQAPMAPMTKSPILREFKPAQPK